MTVDWHIDVVNQPMRSKFYALISVGAVTAADMMEQTRGNRVAEDVHDEDAADVEHGHIDRDEPRLLRACRNRRGIDAPLARAPSHRDLATATSPPRTRRYFTRMMRGFTG
jgi:hypothetical protein